MTGWKPAHYLNFPAKSFDGDGAIAKFGRIIFDMDLKSQFLQTFDHDLRVLAPQRAGERDFAVRQRGENQRAVRDALGAGHGDFRAHRFVERDDFDEIGKSHLTR